MSLNGQPAAASSSSRRRGPPLDRPRLGGVLRARWCESLPGAAIMLLVHLPPRIPAALDGPVVLRPSSRSRRLAPADASSVRRGRCSTRGRSPTPLVEASSARPRATPSSSRSSARGRGASTGPSRPRRWPPDDDPGRPDRPHRPASPRSRRRVLQTASVLGREFAAAPPARPIWDGPGTLEPHLLELKRLEFLHERRRRRASRSTSSSTPSPRTSPTTACWSPADRPSTRRRARPWSSCHAGRLDGGLRPPGPPLLQAPAQQPRRRSSTSSRFAETHRRAATAHAEASKRHPPARLCVHVRAAARR